MEHLYKNYCNREKNKGLTLIEVLAVIAIIGVLAAILIPSTSYVIDKAHKAKAASNLRQIVLSYTACLQEEGPSAFATASNVHDLALLLAQKAQLNDPSLWIISEDILAAKQRGKPRSILGPNQTINEDFGSIPLSFVFATNIPPHICASTTPVAWTRGLKEDGTWDSEKGVYGASGGFIAFLDGHVVWYKNIKDADNQLCHFADYTNTSNIREAIGPHVSILE